MHGVEELIRETRVAAGVNLHYLALFGALALPDICGALASPDGKASGSKYKAWLRANVPQWADDSALIYGLRCSLIHQGRATPHGSVFPMAFTFPSASLAPFMHNSSTEINGEGVVWADIPRLIEDVVTGVERWMSAFGQTTTVKRNYEAFARLRPDGIPGHYHGPVIA